MIVLALLVASTIGSIAQGEAPPRNCLLIVLDALSAKHMSLHGAEDVTTPFLDSIADESVVFEQAHSQYTNTVGSTYSFLTGRYPYARALDGGKADTPPLLIGAIPSTLRSIARFFNERGYATGGFSDNPNVSQARYGAGFDAFVTIDFWGDLPEELQRFRARDDLATKRLLWNLMGFIESTQGKPWFGYIHVMRPHTPYLASQPYGRHFLNPAISNVLSDTDLRRLELIAINQAFNAQRLEKPSDISISPTELEILRQMYRGNIEYADSVVQRIFDWLEKQNLLENTLVIVTADHGDSFLEHGFLLHNTLPYEELIHVPLVFYHPSGSRFRPNTVSTPVELVDLLPTLSEVFDLAKPEGIDGVSLMGLLNGGPKKHKEYLYASSPFTGSASVRKDNLKLIFRTSAGGVLREAYDLEKDPNERVNLFDTADHDLSQQLYDLLARAQAYLSTKANIGTVDETGELSEAEREALRALGYVK
jgi:arylsulfatase